jgi:hypothetical protein
MRAAEEIKMRAMRPMQCWQLRSDKVGRVIIRIINKEKYKRIEKKKKKGILDLSSFSPEREAILQNGSKNCFNSSVNLLPM